MRDTRTAADRLGLVVWQLEQLVGLDDRLGELGHGHPAILALPLQEAERVGLLEVATGHQDPLARSISFRSRSVISSELTFSRRALISGARATATCSAAWRLGLVTGLSR